jgi:5-methylthioadenosine/S-adenosylhomocysteine deaminase
VEEASRQLLQRARLASASALPAAELLELVTIAGARALGLEHVIGSLEPGKDADLCAVRTDLPHTQPVLDPLATLFHAARGSDVVLATVRGRVLFGVGSHVTVDPRALYQPVQQLADRLRAVRDQPG